MKIQTNKSLVVIKINNNSVLYEKNYQYVNYNGLYIKILFF